MTKYFTQWDSDTAGSNIAGWTPRGRNTLNTSYAPQYGTAGRGYGIKRRYLKMLAGTGSGFVLSNLLTWDTIDSDANRANVELLTHFNYDDTTVTQMELWLRESGTTATVVDAGYVARLVLSGSLAISRRLTASTETDLTSGTASFTFAAGKGYFVRFRANSTAMKLRVWDAALGMAGEPTTWNIDTTDATYSAAGSVGFACRATTAGDVAPWSFLAVATNGDTAVCPRTNTEYTAWLDSQSAIRCVLAEMSATGYDSGGSPYTKTVNVYLSNHGYTSQQQDTPSLRHYDNFIQQIPTFTREMSTALSGQATTGFGDLIISNPVETIASGGVRDNWLRMKWNRNYLKLYLGDPSWPKHDFRLMIYGRVGMPSAPTLGQIKFPIADLSDFLNKPLVSTQITTGDYTGQYKPKLMGRLSGHCEPPKTDAATLTFTIDDGSYTADSLVVYDNGVSLITASFTVSAVNTGTGVITASSAHGFVNGYRVRFASGTPPLGLSTGTNYWVVGTTAGTSDFKLSLTQGGAAVTGGAGTTGAAFNGYGYTENAASGTFTTAAAPVGRITATATDSVGGRTAGTIADIVFTVGGLSLNNKDGSTFDAVDTAESAGSQLPGLWLDTQLHTIGEAASRIASGMFCWYGFTTDGLMQLGRIDTPGSTAVQSFTESDVVANSLRLVDTIRPVDFSVVPISYRQWFLTGGPLGVAAQSVQGKTFFSFSSYGASSTPLDEFPANSDPDNTRRFDLLETNSTGMTNQQARLLNLYKWRLGIFEFTTRLSATQLNIGDTISLTHPRYHWKQWTGADDASPDNTATIDSRLAVVIGIATDVAKGQTKIKCFRRIPGYYPTADLN